MHRTADTTRSEVGCTRGGQPHELVQSSSENDILAGSFLPGLNGRCGSHRQKWRCEIQAGRAAAIVGTGDGRPRRRASPEMAMLQLDVRGPGGIVGCGDARAKKSRLGVRGGDDCRRPGREETARVVAALRDFSRCVPRGAGVPAAAVASPHAPGAAPAAVGGLPRSAPGPRLRRPGV